MKVELNWATPRRDIAMEEGGELRKMYHIVADE
jgi:hypothetical protein